MTNRTILSLAITVVGAVSSADASLVPDRATLDAILGANAVNEDFESYVVTITTTLATRFLDSTTIINGQGPALVEPGATYISGSGVPGENFAWQGDGYHELPTKTLVAFMEPGGSMMMTIDYDTSVVAMGIDLFDYESYSHTTMVSVFDPGGFLIESFDLFIGGPGGVFFGYEATAIGSVTITGNPLGWSSVIDNHAYGAGGCLAVTSQEILCHADGTTFTVNIEGLNACTGGTSMFTFTASGGAVGEPLCFTVIVDDGGFCCTTEICVTIPDCTPAAKPSDLNGDGIVGMMDFLALLEAWGFCSDCGTCPADFDGDCSVGILDLLVLLGSWG